MLIKFEKDEVDEKTLGVMKGETFENIKIRDVDMKGILKDCVNGGSYGCVKRENDQTQKYGSTEEPFCRMPDSKKKKIDGNERDMSGIFTTKPERIDDQFCEFDFSTTGADDLDVIMQLVRTLGDSSREKIFEASYFSNILLKEDPFRSNISSQEDPISLCDCSYEDCFQGSICGQCFLSALPCEDDFAMHLPA